MYYFIKLTEHASLSLHCCLCFILLCQWSAGCFPGACRASSLYLGGSLWARSEPQAGQLWWKQQSTINPALDMSRLYKSKAQALASFWTLIGAIRMIHLPNQPLCSWKQSFLISDNIAAGENMLWLEETYSLGREVLSSNFLSISPLINCLFALKHSWNCYCFN